MFRTGLTVGGTLVLEMPALSPMILLRRVLVFFTAPPHWLFLHDLSVLLTETLTNRVAVSAS